MQEGAMADLSSLLQDLGDCIANKSDASGSTQLEEDDPVESRFRSVLPVLLEAYFLPDKVKHREILAILKLVRHTVEHFPGVLFHGKAHAVLPLIGRIIPLFAEPAASACCEGLFDTLRSLVSLLQAGEYDVFRNFFVDATLLVEDLVSVGSFCSTAGKLATSGNVTVHSFQYSFSALKGQEDRFLVPSCWENSVTPGLTIDVTGQARFEPLAVYMIKILSNILIDESSHVHGLVTSSFMSSVGTIMCFGSSALHKACFDMFCVGTSVLHAEIIPCEKAILSIISIVSLSKLELPTYRTAVYDSSLGSCLLSLYAISQANTVEYTARAFLDVFLPTLRTTTSRDLKVALCKVLSIILRQCPSYSSSVMDFLGLIFVPEIISPFSNCLQLAFGSLQRDSTQQEFIKIPVHNPSKRIKLNDDGGLALKPLNDVISMLAPQEDSGIPLDNLLSGYCVLVRTTGKKQQIFQHFCTWLILFRRKSLAASLTKFQLSILLEVIDNLFLSPDVEVPEKTLAEVKESIIEILGLPWSRMQGDGVWKAKLYVLTMLSKLNHVLKELNAYNLVEVALLDEDVRVRSAAVACVPALISSSNASSTIKVYEILRNMLEDKEQVRESLATIIGLIFCINAGKITHTPKVTCLVCDKEDQACSNGQEQTWSPFHEHWKPVITRLLLKDNSCKVQTAIIWNLSRLVRHSDPRISRDIWTECLGIFPVHPDRTVREAFCSQVKCFIFGNNGDNGANADNGDDSYDVLGKLRHALVIAQDPEIVETVMQTVAEVAKVAKCNQLRLFAVVLLIEQLDNRDILARVASVRLIYDVAETLFPDNNQCVEKLVETMKKGLFEYLAGRLVTRPCIFKQFAEAVMKTQTSDLLKQMIPVVLPKLILEQQHDRVNNGKALETLNALARELDTSLPLLLLEWCHKVLSVLLLRADGKELMAALQFYESQTRSDPREIFAAVLPALLDELVRFLGDTVDEETMRRSARVGPMIQEVARIVTGSDDLSNFLRHHFLGLLNSIDRKLLRSGDITLRKQALRCIDRLIDMIGPHLTAFVPKIMTLLSQALQLDPLQHEALIVWLSFVRKLARGFRASLKAVASQIVVALMPCLESEESITVNAAANILEELIVNQRSVLAEQIRELPLLPSLPALSSVNAVLNEARGSLSLREQLLRAAEGLKHDNLSLRHVAATELLKLLHSKQSFITAMILGEAPSDIDAVSSLVVGLLRGCAEESRTSVGQKLKLACAECLGGLGAVDPVKLRQIGLKHRSRMEHNEEDLVFHLITNHLARILRAASDTDVQDAAALAIQELLKLTGCNEARKTTKLKSKDTGDNGLWNRFSDDIKEIITPCLTSKYLLKNSGAANPSGPIFKQGISFRRWMTLWCRRLLCEVSGSLSNILSACKGVIRHDMDTALYLLPYLILDVVSNGSQESFKGVTEEILAVLSEASSDDSKHGQPVYFNNALCSSGGEVSTQTIFMLLDNLGQWVDDSKQSLGQTKKKTRSNNSTQAAKEKEEAARLSLHCERVQELLAGIPKQILASASFRCRAYARALLYYESHVREKCGALNPAAVVQETTRSGAFEDQDMSFLLKIYGGLDEPDGLLGLARLHKHASLEDQVLINKKSGNWAEALTFCEQALEMEPRSVYWQSGVLDCLVNMGHFQAMLTHVDGLLTRLPDSKKEWNIRGVQAAWRLGQWDLIDEYLHGAEMENAGSSSNINGSTFDLSLAKILRALRSKDDFRFHEQLMHARVALLAPLAAASMESYTRAYPVIVKLHMLRELEEFFTLTNKGEDISIISLVEDWNGRLKMSLPSLSTREPILALRRLLFSTYNLQTEMSSCWLQYAKLCRESGHYETANRAILQAQTAGARGAHRERAKLYWDTKQTHRAIDELQQALTGVHPDVLGKASSAALGGLLRNAPVKLTDDKMDVASVAKTLMLLGRWSHHTGQKQKEDVISIYSRVKDLQPTWGKGYFYMAKYYDDLLMDARSRQEKYTKRRDDKPWWSYLPDVILYYAKALHKSHHRLFQALPRLLTLWFEFGSSYHDDTVMTNRILMAAHTKVMSVMKGCLRDLPTYQWLAALPQLVSRICHDNEEVVQLVKQILEIVLHTYPQQALWTMAAVSKSTVAERQSAAAEVIQAAKSAARSEKDRAVFIEFAALLDQMIRLCFAPGPSEKARSLSLAKSEFGTLKRMMPLNIIMPVQRALTVTLPTDGVTNSTYNPFPSGDCATIAAIRDEVEILASLQRPKKVVLIASDGTEHPFLCKPKDDLRKDARMMEFNAMINRLLTKDPSSRRRKLYIRTFAVIPLTEDCGMVEWVLHTRGLRHILVQLYNACGKLDKETNLKIKAIYEASEGKISAAELMRDKILPMFPPVFHKWFLNTFPEPTAWFQSRLAYAHTTAVWSMVGHIVGLGDRHGENILFDSTTGDCVHVDFSCLFDRGLQLEKPELVPFRLTQNMVDGLGITGYEGIFLRTCEITLSVLRAHRETLMSVLETFIHDPLVEWTKSHKSSGTEVQNPHAQRALANIEARLRGVVVGVGAAPSLPLSVEGQANRLILEAVSHENLGHMYIWWMPWF